MPVQNISIAHRVFLIVCRVRHWPIPTFYKNRLDAIAFYYMMDAFHGGRLPPIGLFQSIGLRRISDRSPRAVFRSILKENRVL